MPATIVGVTKNIRGRTGLTPRHRTALAEPQKRTIPPLVHGHTAMVTTVNGSLTLPAWAPGRKAGVRSLHFQPAIPWTSISPLWPILTLHGGSRWTPIPGRKTSSGAQGGGRLGASRAVWATCGGLQKTTRQRLSFWADMAPELLLSHRHQSAPCLLQRSRVTTRMISRSPRRTVGPMPDMWEASLMKK
jgi:hypothetical protein